MEIIPAIDVIGGKCVRLSQGDYSRCSIYDCDPIDVAIRFEKAGIRRLHVVDLEGAREGKIVHFDLLEEICTATCLQVDFSGGIKTEEDLQRVFDSGARWATIGSVAHADPKRVGNWLVKYGSERIILAADVRGTKICINGWRQESDKTIFELIEEFDGVLKNLMCTDIERDGMFLGPSLELYGILRSRYPDLNLIASGGIRSNEDIKNLSQQGIEAVIIGKAFYEGVLTLEEIVID